MRFLFETLSFGSNRRVRCHPIVSSRLASERQTQLTRTERKRPACCRRHLFNLPCLLSKSDFLSSRIRYESKQLRAGQPVANKAALETSATRGARSFDPISRQNICSTRLNSYSGDKLAKINCLLSYRRGGLRRGPSAGGLGTTIGLQLGLAWDADGDDNALLIDWVVPVGLLSSRHSRSIQLVRPKQTSTRTHTHTRDFQKLINKKKINKLNK